VTLYVGHIVLCELATAAGCEGVATFDGMLLTEDGFLEP